MRLMPANMQLFVSDPVNTRYLVKYRHVDAKLVLKVSSLSWQRVCVNVCVCVCVCVCACVRV